MSVQRVMVVPSNPAVRKVAQQEVGVIAVQSLSSRPEGGAAGSGCDCSAITFQPSGRWRSRKWV